jgi:hypothetical protein
MDRLELTEEQRRSVIVAMWGEPDTANVEWTVDRVIAAINRALLRDDRLSLPAELALACKQRAHVRGEGR